MPLPDAPSDFTRERRGAVLWEFPTQAAHVVRALRATAADEWRRIESELGTDVGDALRIRVGRDPDEMAALAPADARPPPYASGVAYPSRGLVLLTLSAPETWERPDLETVLQHELSHVALHRAVGGRSVPRWFTEGVAIYQSGERSLERVQTLWRGTASRSLRPLSTLSEGFPDRPHQVSLAYAQSADFVRWLRAREQGAARFRELVRRLGRGERFESALERAYSTSPGRLESDWLASLEERFQAWPLLLSGGGFGVVTTALLVLAYLRRKRDAARRLHEWELEEHAERIREEQEALRVARLASVYGMASETDDDEPLLFMLPAEPRVRDSGVPTVRHEGRSHTLH